MRPSFQKLHNHPDRSFRVAEHVLPRFDAPWHFHPEIELTLIVESEGRRFIGDSIEPFAAEDLVLVGPNLPHFWHNDDRLASETRARAVVVQFPRDFLGADLWSRVEFTRVRRMLDRSSRGLHFTGEVARKAATQMRELPALRSLRAVIALWSTLDLLASTTEVRALASPAYAPNLNDRGEHRMAQVYAFLLQHYTEPLTLPQIAKVAAMTPVAFSRYFKRAAGQNVSDFLNDLRIGRAAQLLQDSDDSVTRIAADAGYETISNFNRRFRERFGCSPREYRRELGNHADEPTAAVMAGGNAAG